MSCSGSVGILYGLFSYLQADLVSGKFAGQHSFAPPGLVCFFTFIHGLRGQGKMRFTIAASRPSG
jgi:hypothetical protein